LVLGSVYIVRHGTTRHGTAQHHTTRRSILSWFSHAEIHITPSRIADVTDSVVGIERREYFASLLTDGRCECTLVFVVSCRYCVVPYNVNRPLFLKNEVYPAKLDDLKRLYAHLNR
jgi:hypothetical protein